MLYAPPEAGRRLLHVLARNFGRPRTVQDLTDETKRLHGSAHYANTYRELRRMRAAGLLRWETHGQGALIQLEPDTPLLLDYLVQLEAWKRLWIFGDRPDAAPKAERVAAALQSDVGLETAWWLEARRSIRLNRLPLLLAYRADPGIPAQGLRGVAARTDARLDVLPMASRALADALASPVVHPLRPWLADAIALCGAEAHWRRWLEAARHGSSPWLSGQATPTTHAETTASLAHYGYEEFGSTAPLLPPLRLEALVVAVLRGASARRRAAVPRLLATNDFDPALLAFLAHREGLEKELGRIAQGRGLRGSRLRHLRAQMKRA